MKALSIQQPYSWLIINGIKDIENRDWPTSFRGWFLIHTGKKPDRNAFYGYSHRFGAVPDGVDDLAFLRTMPVMEEYEIGGIVGYAKLVDCVTRSDSPWFRGLYGFVLQDARPLPFYPLKGQLGFFEVADEIVASIKQAIQQEKGV